MRGVLIGLMTLSLLILATPALAESSYSLFQVSPSQHYLFEESQVETFAGFTQYRLGEKTQGDDEPFQAETAGQTIGATATVRADKSTVFNIEARQSRFTSKSSFDDEEYDTVSSVLIPSITAHVKNAVALGVEFQYQRHDDDDISDTSRYTRLSVAGYSKSGEVGIAYTPGYRTETVPKVGEASSYDNAPEWLLHGSLNANSRSKIHGSVHRIQYGNVEEEYRDANESDIYFYTAGVEGLLSPDFVLGVAGTHKTAGYDSREDAFFANIATNSLAIELRGEFSSTMSAGIQATAVRGEEKVATDLGGTEPVETTHRQEGESVALTLGVAF